MKLYANTRELPNNELAFNLRHKLPRKSKSTYTVYVDGTSIHALITQAAKQINDLTGKTAHYEH